MTIRSLNTIVAAFEGERTVAEKFIGAIRVGACAITPPIDFHIMPVLEPLVMCLVTKSMFYHIPRKRIATPWFEANSEMKGYNIRDVTSATIFAGLESQCKYGKETTVSEAFSSSKLAATATFNRKFLLPGSCDNDLELYHLPLPS
jgi:hypothetical protein